jgi:hypothetical protein
MRNREFSRLALLRGAFLSLIVLLIGCSPSTEQKLKDENAAKEKHVLEAVKIGMTRDQVIEKMGKPNFENIGSDGFPMMVYIEHGPNPPIKENWGYGGFSVSLKDGKVTRVDITHRDVN